MGTTPDGELLTSGTTGFSSEMTEKEVMEIFIDALKKADTEDKFNDVLEVGDFRVKIGKAAPHEKLPSTVREQMGEDVVRTFYPKSGPGVWRIEETSSGGLEKELVSTGP
jgi:hypothetical protein